MARPLQLLLSMVFLTSGCTVIDLSLPWAPNNSAVAVFPSPYLSDGDFLNLVSDDPPARDRARRNVYEFFNCLRSVKSNSGRQDPMVFFRSQYIAFSEIPGRIYQSRLDQLAVLAKDYHKAAVQSVVDAEMINLRKIRWNEIQVEVNAIVTRGGKTELATLECPLTQEPRRIPVPKEPGSFLRAAFLPPNM
jgi:hypothetical protein